MKRKHLDWILRLKYDHMVWPWPWPWPWNFKIKFWNSLISGIGGPIDIEQKGVFLDLYRDHQVTKMRCNDLPDSDRVTSDVGVPSTLLVWEYIFTICTKSISTQSEQKCVRNGLTLTLSRYRSLYWFGVICGMSLPQTMSPCWRRGPVTWVSHHWFRKRFGAEQTRSHHSNQYWHSLPTPRWLNSLGPSDAYMRQ